MNAWEGRAAQLRRRYPEQFEDLPYYMVSIDPGWFEPIEAACRRIDALLTPKEKALFRWRQIKEKFGGLRMYWNEGGVYLDFIGPDSLAHIVVEPLQPQLSARTRERIAKIVAQAAKQAARRCQVCGAPGQLRRRQNGWLVTACERHVEPPELSDPQVDED
ncbi:MAG: hypothetical protein GAKPKEKM_01505 [Rhodocyclaceae bacterium]|nr:hypothetical protein [Rhodocyclaceae bacterium]